MAMSISARETVNAGRNRTTSFPAGSTITPRCHSRRINSTWGGNLTDMVRARRILEVIEADELFDRAAEQGRYLRDRLDELADEFPAMVIDPRGRGLMCAFSLPATADRDELIAQLWQRCVIVLPAGKDGVRFRPALTVSRTEIDLAIAAVRDVLTAAA